MPVSKKRKKPEKKRRARDGERAVPEPHAGAPAESAPGSGGGFLSRMRGGLQSVAGAGPKKKESLASKLVTWLLVAAVVWFVAKRFGIIK